MTKVKVGDEVQYVPHTLHAKQPYPDGTFCWLFGWRRNRQEGREIRTEMTELTPKRLKEQIAYLAKHSDPSAERNHLVPLMPLKLWNATVSAVNADGTVDLVIEVGSRSGVTLNYRDVPVVARSKFDGVGRQQRPADSAHPLAALAHHCVVEDIA